MVAVEMLFFILGSDAAMRRAFKDAGWVTVDTDVVGAVITGVLGSLSKEAYLTMPMSQLYLFDRPQDFGWAHAEPIRVVASRHHLRVWKAPMTVAGATRWTGAATHDIGLRARPAQQWRHAQNRREHRSRT